MSRTPSPTLEGCADEATLLPRALLITLLAGASFAFSLAFACATPFAGLAAVAALRMKRSEALAAVSLAWLVNQANGFLVLHYPREWSTMGWGVAIWVSAITAVYAAAALPRLTSTFGVQIVAATAALACAFLAYEAVLFAATFVLPSAPGAFSMAVVRRLFAIDAAAFALLLAVIGALRTLRLGALRAPFSRACGRRGPLRLQGSDEGG